MVLGYNNINMIYIPCVFQIVQRNILSYVNSLSKALFKSSTKLSRLSEDVLYCFKEFVDDTQRFNVLNEMDDEFVM